MDDDAKEIQLLPGIRTCVLVLQRVQGVCRHILTFGVSSGRDGNTVGSCHNTVFIITGGDTMCLQVNQIYIRNGRSDGIDNVFENNTISSCHFGMRLNKHFAVLGEFPLIIIIQYVVSVITPFMLIVVAFIQSIVAVASLHTFTEGAVWHLIGTIYIADITATEDVTIFTGDTSISAHLTAMDVYFGLAEHITVGEKRTMLSKVVVAASAAEHVAMHVTTKQFDISLAWSVDLTNCADGVVGATGINLTTPDGGDLAAPEEGITHMTAIHLHLGEVHTTVVDIAATEDTAAVIKVAVGFEMAVGVKVIGLVFNLLHIIILLLIVFVSDVTVIHGDMGSAIYRTTLAAAVGIAHHGGDTLCEAIPIRIVFRLQDTNHHMRLTRYVIGRVAGNHVVVGFAVLSGLHTRMLAHSTFPAAAIDITAATALDVGIGTGGEAVFI